MHSILYFLTLVGPGSHSWLPIHVSGEPSAGHENLLGSDERNKPWVRSPRNHYKPLKDYPSLKFELTHNKCHHDLTERLGLQLMMA